MTKKNEELAQFTWLETYTNALESLPSTTDKAMLALAIVEYGALGKEPKFVDTKTFPAIAFKAIFEACRWNIDEGRGRYLKGKSGSGWGRRPEGEPKGDYYARKFHQFHDAGDEKNARTAYEKALEHGVSPEDYEQAQVPDDGYDYSSEPRDTPPAFSFCDLDVDISRDLGAL
ncbi:MULTISPECIES: hypothetical protein [unclassified Adlercreutzia]|uniref:hypothetical protein n=1 Tax=unclassified Adlercreutzia TaxID=2636013 RepID=UPI0013EC5706|nr:MULTISPECIES: hypothetical protein [unclassified Adlercreutzia]